jgi:hypothetical protein
MPNRPPSAMDRVRYFVHHPEKDLPVRIGPDGRPHIKLPVQCRCLCIHLPTDHGDGCNGPCTKCPKGVCPKMRPDPAYLLDPQDPVLAEFNRMIKKRFPHARSFTGLELEMGGREFDPRAIALANRAREEAVRLGVIPGPSQSDQHSGR